MDISKKYILSKEVAEKKLRRMAYEILENNLDEKEIILAGIQENGSVVAKTIQRMLKEISTLNTELISLSINKKDPKEISIKPALKFENKVIIIIDDVSNSGRTLLYSLKPFLDFYPKNIQSLVLVERSHTSFPVRPDYVGLSISSTIQEHIYVEVNGGEVTGAYLQ
jgi:pyrimidine operon attenuation protein/uracil phosphoribosyltransferase